MRIFFIGLILVGIFLMVVGVSLVMSIMFGEQQERCEKAGGVAVKQAYHVVCIKSDAVLDVR